MYEKWLSVPYVEDTNIGDKIKLTGIQMDFSEMCFEFEDLEAMDETTGVCFKCGAVHDIIGKDDEQIKCEECGKLSVYGKYASMKRNLSKFSFSATKL